MAPSRLRVYAGWQIEGLDALEDAAGAFLGDLRKENIAM
jgi:hypothetical protein